MRLKLRNSPKLSWAPEVAGTTSGRSHILCFSSPLLVREDFLPVRLTFRGGSGVEVQGPGGLVNVIMCAKPLQECLARKFKVFLLLLLLFQFPEL